MTRIIVVDFLDFFSYRYFDVFVNHFNIDHEKMIGHNPYLYMIWNEKSHFLKRAIELNPFGNDYYLWVDIGCFRYKTDDFLNYPNPSKIECQDKSKVLLLAVQPYSQQELDSTQLSELPDYTKLYRISGTIFGGGQEVLRQWHDKYYSMLEQFIGQNRFIGLHLGNGLFERVEFIEPDSDRFQEPFRAAQQTLSPRHYTTPSRLKALSPSKGPFTLSKSLRA